MYHMCRNKLSISDSQGEGSESFKIFPSPPFSLHRPVTILYSGVPVGVFSTHTHVRKYIAVFVLVVSRELHVQHVHVVMDLPTA